MGKKDEGKNKPKPCQCNGTGEIFVMAGEGIFVPIPCPSCR